MADETVTCTIDGTDLDPLRTQLTRGDERILLRSESGNLTVSDVESFLKELRCDGYEVIFADREEGGSPPETVVLKRMSTRDSFPKPGIHNRELADDRGPITDFSLRMVDLGLLRVREGMTVWEIGAGTGSVSVESARLNPSSRYFAVEEDDERVETLRRNIHDCHVYNITVVHGPAPESLTGLPAPDRVFLGGTHGELESILELLPGRLSENGLVLANFLALENLKKAVRFFEDAGLQVDVFQLACHEGRTIETGDIRWQEGPALPVLRARFPRSDPRL